MSTPGLSVSQGNCIFFHFPIRTIFACSPHDCAPMKLSCERHFSAGDAADRPASSRIPAARTARRRQPSRSDARCRRSRPGAGPSSSSHSGGAAPRLRSTRHRRRVAGAGSRTQLCCSARTAMNVGRRLSSAWRRRGSAGWCLSRADRAASRGRRKFRGPAPAHIRGDERSGSFRGLDDDDAAGEAGDDPVAAGEVTRLRRLSERHLGRRSRRPCALFVKRRVFRRIDVVDAAGDDGDGAARKRAFMRRCVDAARQCRRRRQDPRRPDRRASCPGELASQRRTRCARRRWQ